MMLYYYSCSIEELQNGKRKQFFESTQVGCSYPIFIAVSILSPVITQILIPAFSSLPMHSGTCEKEIIKNRYIYKRSIGLITWAVKTARNNKQ